MQFTTVEKVGFLGPKKWKKLVLWVPKLKKLGFWVLQILCQPSCKIRKSREIPGYFPTGTAKKFPEGREKVVNEISRSRSRRERDGPFPDFAHL